MVNGISKTGICEANNSTELGAYMPDIMPFKKIYAYIREVSNKLLLLKI